MIEDLENIYIYIEDNLDIQFEPDLRQLGKWAPSVYICINQKKELTCITIHGDKSVYETKHMDRLPDVIKSVMDRDSLTSLTISDYDILDICSKYKITPEIDDEKYDLLDFSCIIQIKCLSLQPKVDYIILPWC